MTILTTLRFQVCNSIVWQTHLPSAVFFHIIGTIVVQYSTTVVIIVQLEGLMVIPSLLVCFSKFEDECILRPNLLTLLKRVSLYYNVHFGFPCLSAYSMLNVCARDVGHSMLQFCVWTHDCCILSRMDGTFLKFRFLNKLMRFNSMWCGISIS